MSLLETQADGRPCRDPECDGYAEPEVDGEHRYFECQECGFEFGYERMDVQLTSDTCAVGIPETMRRAFSGKMEEALASEAASKPQLLQIGKKPSSE